MSVAHIAQSARRGLGWMLCALPLMVGCGDGGEGAADGSLRPKVGVPIPAPPQDGQGPGRRAKAHGQAGHEAGGAEEDAAEEDAAEEDAAEDEGDAAPERRKARPTWGDLSLGDARLRSPGGVNLLLFTDDHTLVSGGWDGRVVGQSVKDGSPTHVIEPFGGRAVLGGAAMVGGRVILGGQGGRAALLDVAKGTYQGAPSVLNGERFALSGDGARIALPRKTGRISLFDLPAATPLGELSPEGRATAIALDADGGRALVGDQRGRLQAFKTEGGAELWARTPHGQGLVALEVSPGGDAFASSASDGTLFYGALASGEPLGTLQDPGGVVHALAFAPGGGALYGAAADGSILRWSLPGGAILAREALFQAIPSALAVSPDGGLVAAGDRAGMIELLDGRTLARRTPIDPALRHGHWVTEAVAAGPRGPFATLSRDGGVRIWSGAGALTGFISPEGAQVQAIALSPDGAALALGFADGRVRVQQVDSGAARWDLNLGQGAVVGLAFIEGGRALVAAGPGRRVLVLASEGGAIRRTLGPAPGVPQSLVMDPRGQTAALALKGGRIWRTSLTGRPDTRVFKLPQGEVSGVGFGPRGDLLVAAADKGVYLFGRSPGAPAHLKPGAAITALAVDPAGEVLFLGARDGKVTEWGYNTLTEVGVVGAHLRGVTQASSGGPGLLVTASEDGTAHVWRTGDGP